MEQIDQRKFLQFFSYDGKNIYEKAEDTVCRYGMEKYIESGVLVGLSGGADSVMLLCFLMEYRRRRELDFSIVCVHVNHGIRGEEADNDQEFCHRLCDELGVEFIAQSYNVPQLAKSSRVGLEEAARMTRYSIFQWIIRGRDDLGAVAVAHNMSDNAETVIFNILRGSGARGASGIRPIRDNIIRPLIEITKSEITSALDAAGIPYVIDSTNICRDYTRNYIRHDVIPAFKRINDDPEKMLSRFSANLRSDDDYITSVAKEFVDARKIIKNIDLLSLHYSVYIRVLTIMAGKTTGNISSIVASDVHKLLEKENFSYSIGGGAIFVCERGLCRVSRNIGEKIVFCIEVNEGVTSLEPFKADCILSRGKIDKTYLNVYKMSIQANLSSAIIDGSLYFRPKKDGDVVYYGGMTHKLKKLFSDKKIPLSLRGYIPILCDNKGVVWVPGFGVRDDGVPKDKRSDLFVALGIRSEDNDDQRIYFGSEFDL